MSPAQFYALTYAELVLILAGRTEARKRALKERQEEHAWMLTWLLLPHQDKDAEPVTVDQIMGRKPRGKRRVRFTNMEESASAWFAAYQAQSQQEVEPNGNGKRCNHHRSR